MTRQNRFTIAAIALLISSCDFREQQAVLDGSVALTTAGLATTVPPDVRRVWAATQESPAVSPNGRYVTYVDWTTGDIGMHDIVTGQDRRITDKGSWQDNPGFAESSVFSPDSRRVAYNFFGNHRVPNTRFHYELRVVTLGDTTQRTLLKVDSTGGPMMPLDWSEKAGILVSVGRSGNMDFELVLLDPETRAERVLRTFRRDDGPAYAGFVSPDGRHVVYRAGRDLRIIRTDGSADHSLDTDIRWLLGWAPNGAGLLVHATANGETGIWQLPIADGRRVGALRLVRGGMAAFQPGGVAGSRYFYRVPVDAPRIYLTSVDPARGQVLSPPVAITTPVQGLAATPRWSPDGRTLAYVLYDPSLRSQRFMLREADGDAVRELAVIEETTQMQRLEWTPDGGALMVQLCCGEATRLRRIDIRTGEVSFANIPTRYWTLAPDGSVISAEENRPRPGVTPKIVAHNLRTGAKRVLLELNETMERPGAVSPDGRSLALITGTDVQGPTRLIVVPLDGSGALREIARAERPNHFHQRRVINWTPDGRFILASFSRQQDDSDRHIVAYPVNGGAPISLLDAKGVNGQLSHHLHPDGSRLAYSEGSLRQELWVLDDLSPRGR